MSRRPHHPRFFLCRAAASTAGAGVLLAATLLGGCASEGDADALATAAPTAPAPAAGDDRAAVQSGASPENDRSRARREAWAQAIAGVAIRDGRLAVQVPLAGDAGDAAAALDEAAAEARVNHRTAAVAAAVRAARITPADAGAWRVLAGALRDKGEEDLAEAARRTVIAIGRDRGTLRATDLLDLAEQLARMSGREEEALDAARTAVALDDACGPAHRFLAMRLALRGELDAARPHARAAANAGTPVPPQLARRLEQG